MKKTLAIILALALVLCMMPSAAFATDVDASAETVESVAVADIPAQTYTGSAITPEPSVTAVITKTDGTNRKEVTLEKGVDYDVTYLDNTNAGTATAKVIFKNNFSGSDKVEKTFTINPLNLSLQNNGVVITETGVITDASDAASKVNVSFGGQNITSTFDISAAVSSSDNGTILITITPKADNNNFTGKQTKAFYKKTVFDITYKVTAPDMAYTGQPRIPALTFMKDNSRIYLTEGTDYKVTYSDNTNAGACAITVTGVGKYSGEITGSFNITPKSISGVTITIPNVTQGGTIAPAVKDGTKTLVEGTDYTYAPQDTTTAGTRTLTITGIGNYSGTKNASYTVINSNNVFNYSNVTFATYTPYYNASRQYQTVTVKFGNTVLRSGVDYKVEYTSTKNGKTTTESYAQDANDYVVTVTGIGNYAGSVTGSFRIVPVPLDWAEIILSGSTTTYGSYTVPKVSVRHIGGGFYFPESDYAVSYKYLGSSSAYLKPTVVITPTANGNLTTGTNGKTFLEKEITYSARSISNCTVNFTDYRSSKAYNGTLTKPTVVVRDYSQNKTLILNSDYTVTYKDAAGKTVTGFRDAGTYTVEIKGCGAYSGTTTLTYTITGTDISRYTVTLNTTSVNATGTAQRPTIVSVKYGTTSTLSSADYEVSYQDSTGKTVTSMITPGMYKVVVSGKNGYSGSTSASFRIVGTPQQISIPKTAYKVYKDSESFKITATATGDGTGFSYVSSDPSVATVSATGVVTIHKIGRAKITVTTTGMKKSDPAFDDVYVKVYPDKEKITQKPFTEGKTKSFRVRWDKQDDVTYYEVRYARNSSFRAGTYTTKKVNASTLNYDTQSTQIKTSYSKAKYYVKVRAVKVVYNDYGQELKYYGTWSNWRSVVTK